MTVRQLKLVAAVSLVLSASAGNAAEEVQAVQLYSQEALLNMIDNNTHLDRVVMDRCQLVQDIEARAETLKIPAYQFLWGDMLAWGVCVEADPERGIAQIQDAADQGLAAALEQLGRYYALGTLVQKDVDRGIIFLREASALGNLKAQLRLADLFIEGHGSPYDYQDAYHWLYNAITDDKKTHQRIADCLTALANLMHPKAVRLAKRPLEN
ncbi:sel1 repeat family protein [Aestuariibacter halophilus]|uniref:Sel1 repeat family protein n=1 Tax=Fluctibacter halophilus TaxID=226011 RepID=A0ABS8GA32_9ALTE|nr:tetratricopeptide repeat protein [Aestuariibacter halophilus]MCC2617268.1 sel1 repeat family protein [Aestuariibacter halophilus]